TTAYYSDLPVIGSLVYCECDALDQRFPTVGPMIPFLTLRLTILKMGSSSLPPVLIMLALSCVLVVEACSSLFRVCRTKGETGCNRLELAATVRAHLKGKPYTTYPGGPKIQKVYGGQRTFGGWLGELGMKKVEFREIVPTFLRVENPLRKITLSTLDHNPNLDLPVIGSLVFCKREALDPAGTEAGYVRLQNKLMNTDKSERERECSGQAHPDKLAGCSFP
ncbi:unnamed protein product, partial [Timema podura]|nr:unnamed protein product [Timema podura]